LSTMRTGRGEEEMTDEDKCIICGKEWDNGSLICDECEEAFWKDEEAILGYFHFCGVPATIEDIRKWMKT